MKKTYTNKKTFMGGINTMNLESKTKWTKERDKALHDILMSNKEQFNEELKDFLIVAFEKTGYDTSFYKTSDFSNLYNEYIGTNNEKIKKIIKDFVWKGKNKDLLSEFHDVFYIFLLSDHATVSKLNNETNENKCMLFVFSMAYLYFKNNYNRIEFMNVLFEIVEKIQDGSIKERVSLIADGINLLGLNIDKLHNYVNYISQFYA